MTFKPDSTINLCNVPFDSTYKHQIKFESLEEQQNYFIGKRVKQFSNYLTIRRTLQGGGLQSSVKVDACIDDLQGCNYMMYRNANHGVKWFYAFITRLVYISEGTTEIVFETDVWQTWQFDIEILKSYVVREHSEHDKLFENCVPEKFTFEDYYLTEMEQITEESINLDEWGYLVGSTELNFDTTSLTAGHIMSGIYQGLYFYYYASEAELSEFLAEQDADCIQFITLIPKFCVSNASIGAHEIDQAKGQGFIYANQKPATARMYFMYEPISEGETFRGYEPKNKKLFASPYTIILVTNHSGQRAEYKPEDFSKAETGERSIQFELHGDISANPSVTLIPCYHQMLDVNVDAGISIRDFPQCSFTSDTFKLWLAKNQGGVALESLANIGQILTGVITTVGTSGAGSAIGATMITSGATGILNTVNNVYKASKEPNSSNGGAPKNNLLTAMGQNKFGFYIQCIKRQYAETVDNFFTMYGYQTNKLKLPNLSSRPFFNYVETVDANIIGAIPADDLRAIKAMFNNGVTLWKPTSTVGNYSVDNSPTD